MQIEQTPPYNEPAFPVTDASAVQYYGLSARDVFAMAALPAIITATSGGLHTPAPHLEGATVIERIAKDAYLIADAMLRER